MKIDNIMPSLNNARKRSKELVKEFDFVLDDKLKNIGEGKKYSVQTYGCQGNEADSETISGILELIGFSKSDTDDADIVILNTCAIRENAENRIWGELGRLKSLKNNKELLIGICGCMPQEEVVVNKIISKYPYLDLIFGTHNIFRLPELIKKRYDTKKMVVEVFSKEGDIYENIPKIRENKHKAWVNIMYGCDEFCTYCIVPYTRGKERSRSPKKIIEEVTSLVKEGYSEVTLLGQNVNAYGKDLIYSNYTFGNLLYDLDKTGIKRIRFTTSHPRDLDDLTINAIKDCKSVMPHIHLPVQSGSTDILKKMNRKYTKEDYLILVDKLKKAVPDIAITTDIIVGFPNESDNDFLETLDLVDKVNFEGAFTFIYSKREGTPAARYEDFISPEVKKERLYKLNEKINLGYLNGNKRFLNKVVYVLVDEISKNNPEFLQGYSEHNKLVNFKGDPSLIGKIVPVLITEAKTWFLIGKLDE